LVYVKRLTVPLGELGEAVEELMRWRGPRSGKSLSMLAIYFPGHLRHMARGVAADRALIIAHTA